MSDHDVELPPEEQSRDSSDDVEVMKQNIIRESKSHSIESGLTGGVELEPEEEPKDARGLTASDWKALDELGIDRQTLKPTRAPAERAPTEEEIGLLDQAATRELEWGGEEIASGLRYAERDPDGWMGFVEAALAEEIEPILEQFGAVDLEDLEESDSWQQLSDDEREEILAEVRESDAARYANSVIQALGEAERPQVEAELAEARAKEQETAREIWGSTVLNSLGASHLDAAQLEMLGSELDGLQDALRSDPELMESFVDGFSLEHPGHLALLQAMAKPLHEFQPNDPELAVACRALRIVGGLVTRSKGPDMKLLEASGTLPLVDSARRAYLEEAMEYTRRPVITMAALRRALASDPQPARSGKQMAKDLRSGKRSGTTHEQITAEISRAARRTAKLAKERAAREHGVRQ